MCRDSLSVDSSPPKKTQQPFHAASFCLTTHVASNFVVSGNFSVAVLCSNVQKKPSQTSRVLKQFYNSRLLCLLKLNRVDLQKLKCVAECVR